MEVRCFEKVELAGPDLKHILIRIGFFLRDLYRGYYKGYYKGSMIYIPIFDLL